MLSFLFIITTCMFVIVRLSLYAISLRHKTAILTPASGFTVVVPYRNEIENLPKLINSLLAAPAMRTTPILFVNDHSTDGSYKYVNEQLHRFCQGSVNQSLAYNQHGKKYAIQQALRLAKSSYVIQLDADVTVPARFMDEHMTHLSSGKKLSVGTVNIMTDGSLESYLQQDEQALMNTVNLSMHLLVHRFPGLGLAFASGANLAYNREWHLQTKPFEKNMNIASGDDMYVLHAALNSPKGQDIIGLCKSPTSVVHTAATRDFTTYLRQRVRWASKPVNKKIPANLIEQVAGVIGMFLFFGSLTQWLIQPTNYLILVCLVALAASLAVGSGFELSKYGIKSYAIFRLLRAFLLPFRWLAVAMSIPIVKLQWKSRDIR